MKNTCYILTMFFTSTLFVTSYAQEFKVIDNKGTIKTVENSKWTQSGTTIFNKNSGSVGIGNSSPTTTLEISGSPTSSSVADGVMIPKLTGEQLRLKNAKYTSAQNGTMVYVTVRDVAPSGQTINVTDAGFYYYDGTAWQKVSTSISNWNITGNSGTSSTNFLGTTDGQDLIIKTQNKEKLRVFSLNTIPAIGIDRNSLSGINGGASSFSGPTVFLGNAGNFSSSTGFDFIIDDDNNATNSQFKFKANGDGATGTVELMQINETGNVGIGLINDNVATAKLHTNGTVRFENLGANTTNTKILTTDDTGETTTRLLSNLIKINDLKDGKSDNDGTQNGSSLFLGSSAGENDDSDNRQNVGVGFESLKSNSDGIQNVAVGYRSLNKTTGSYNTSVGTNSLSSNTTGANNTATGMGSLSTNSDGNNNTAYGVGTLKKNNGSSNIAIGFEALLENNTPSNNIAIGYWALKDNANVSDLVAIGSNSMLANTSGINNTAIGTKTMLANTSGSGNTAVGFNSMLNNTTGEGNTAIGSNAMSTNSIGKSNTAIGFNSMQSNTTGEGNTAIGSNAMSTNSIGKSNTAIGFNSMQSNTTGEGNTAIGSSAMSTNSTGISNTAIGFNSLQSNTTGQRNTATGYNALQKNTEGSYNVAVGHEALLRNTTGIRNTATGYASLQNNSTGNANAAYGIESLVSNTTGNSNNAMGYMALNGNTIGTGNIGLGNSALKSNTTGSNNTAIGLNALTIISGSNNTAVGVNALNLNTTGNNNIAIGYNAQSSSSVAANEVTIGTATNTVYRAYANWTNPSDSRLKHDISNIPVGLNLISSLRPVQFVYNNSNNEQKTYGFIAQEVKKALEDNNIKDQVIVTNFDEKYLGMKQSELIPVLTRAIQEQQIQIEALKEALSKYSALESRLQILEQRNK